MVIGFLVGHLSERRSTLPSKSTMCFCEITGTTPFVLVMILEDSSSGDEVSNGTGVMELGVMLKVALEDGGVSRICDGDPLETNCPPCPWYREDLDMLDPHHQHKLERNHPKDGW